jgi:hypothetical protein
MPSRQATRAASLQSLSDANADGQFKRGTDRRSNYLADPTDALVRLLDLIVQGRCAEVRSNDGCDLPGAAGFRNAIRDCPLRYVLSDELVRCATQLAYAEGDRLSGCLDLIHVPARALWVEWSEPPRLEALQGIPSLEVTIERSAKRAGVLVRAAPDCRSGTIRTFWSTQTERVLLSPMITLFDLDDSVRVPGQPVPYSWRGNAFLYMQEEPAINEILGHLQFRLDEQWAQYYQERCLDPALKDQVLRANLGHCAFDAPMILAFSLLLGAGDLLPRQTIDQERLNRARRKAGKPALLEHIEVTAPIDKPWLQTPARTGALGRVSPRLHHVRGHLVRRDSTVFWRSPHLRGSSRLGQVRSRTVTISYRGMPRRGAPSQPAQSG